MKKEGSAGSLAATDWQLGRGAQLGLSNHSGEFAAAGDVEIMQFPSEKWKGNDDPKSITGEDNNPYSATDSYISSGAEESVDPKAEIGQVASYD